MVTVAYSIHFERCVRKIRDNSQKERVKAQIIRIVQDPEDRKIEKPMRWSQEKYGGSPYRHTASRIAMIKRMIQSYFFRCITKMNNNHYHRNPMFQFPPNEMGYDVMRLATSLLSVNVLTG